MRRLFLILACIAPPAFLVALMLSPVWTVAAVLVLLVGAGLVASFTGAFRFFFDMEP